MARTAARVSAVAGHDWLAWRARTHTTLCHEAVVQLVQYIAIGLRQLFADIFPFRDSLRSCLRCAFYNATAMANSASRNSSTIFPHTLYSHTHGDWRRSPLRTWWRGMERARRGSARSDSAESRLDVMAYTSSRLIRVASTNRVVLSSQRLTLCFDGTVMLRNAIFICQMFRRLLSTSATSLVSFPRNRHSEQADGLREAGPFRSSLLRHQWSSSLRIGSF
jgi:hypothetical protein